MLPYPLIRGLMQKLTDTLTNINLAKQAEFLREKTANCNLRLKMTYMCIAPSDFENIAMVGNHNNHT